MEAIIFKDKACTTHLVIPIVSHHLSFSYLLIIPTHYSHHHSNSLYSFSHSQIRNSPKENSIFQPRTINYTQSPHPSWIIPQGMSLKRSNSCMKQIKFTKISKTHFMYKPNFSQNPFNKIRSFGKFQNISYFSRITMIISRK